jgi:stearoyl-CoA desaturase (delta-9 desaturase)
MMLRSPIILKSLTADFPNVIGIRWFNLSVLIATPAIALYGLLFVPYKLETILASLLYYGITMLGAYTAF